MKISRNNGTLAACVFALAVVGYLDYVTGREVHFGFFYLLPVIAAASLAGHRRGFAMAVLCAAVRTAVEWYSGPPFTHVSLFIWNTCVRLCTFLTVAFLAGYIRKPSNLAAQSQAPEPVSGIDADIEFRPYENRLPITNKAGRLLWTVVWSFLFRPTPRAFDGWRAFLLRCFGARVGNWCRIDPSCKIWAPWNLELGNSCLIEARVDCYTVDRIVIGNRSIISQSAYLCSASHDPSDPTLRLTHAPIRIGDDAWVGARAFVRPGITIGAGGVAGACAVVTRDVEPWTLVAGSPARFVHRRARPPEDGAFPDAEAVTAGASTRVGIVTFHMSSNYGAMLQTYALQEALKRVGCRVSIIDYQPDYITRGGKWLWPFTRRNVYADAGILLIKLERLQAFLFGRERHRYFGEFRERFLRVAAPRYETLESLRAHPPACDVLVCGSDQIWNPPPRFGVDPAFYLAFGPQTCRRLSFAASFGKATVEPEYRTEIGRLLSGLDEISVRESSGVRIAEQLSGRRCSWMPDPTLLMDDYERVMIRPADTAYLLSYCLCSSHNVARVQRAAARFFGLPIVTPATPGMSRMPGVHVVQVGPQGWLGHIAQSRMVVTNSFHGTVFSILFKRRFVTVKIQGRKSDLNERFASLLTRLGLERRLLDANVSDVEMIRVLQEPIDWEETQVRLTAWREEAWALLRMATAVKPATPARTARADGRNADR